ncbi:TolC family protein [Desertivirga xinjiangensis]|uniref:TolC family protein n=1 Tax=Desertivirga xinjiangensis TaxID=539206 RepID=UPI00210D5051|nr:TolC family protein [Pedobacter xinjiangensis]
MLMIKKAIKASLLLVLLFFAGQAKSQETIMTDVSYEYLEKLVATALENYPRTKNASSRINIAESNINKAKLNWLTPVSLSYVHSPENNLNVVNPTFFSGYQVGVFLNIGSILQTPSNIKIAKEELKIAKNDIAEYNLTLSTEVKRRYFSYLQAVKTVQIASRTTIDAETNLVHMKYKFERGEVALESYNTALDRAGSSSLAKVAAEGTLLSTKASLEELLGVKLEEIK